MRLTRFLSEDLVLVNPPAADKWELLDGLIEAVMRSGAVRAARVGREAVRDAVVARERERTTAAGGGLAFPHARVKGLKGLALAVAVCAEGLAFDGDTVRIAFLVLTPDEEPSLAVKVMGGLAKFLADPLERERLVSASGPGDVVRRLRRVDLDIHAPIRASDIMRPPLVSVRPDTPLREVTRQMLQHGIEALPVMENDGRVAGEITCDLLFQYGIPDFFRQLTSVSFISEFDPFEKYFQREAEAVASDVMSRDFASLPEAATLLEIVFALAVQGHPKVYITSADGALVGVVDRTTVLDKVINV